MISDLIATARESLTVTRVFGEPYERDGVTVLPVATVAGGGGGGSGQEKADGPNGEGGGFGLALKPAGVYVLSGGDVRWRPAIDVNRLAMTLAAVLIAAMCTRIQVQRAKTRRRR